MHETCSQIEYVISNTIHINIALIQFKIIVINVMYREVFFKKDTKRLVVSITLSD